MKRLKRIIFVNWYLFDSRQFDLRGDVLITGSNGSGKTALLDAIQVVALGGHGSNIQLNANAAEKGERTIKSYCLGQLSDDDGNSTSSFRDDAISHIALVFEDEDTGASITVGIAMSAKKSQPKHEVLGLYIIDGLCLSLDDYLNETTDGDMPLSWEQLKQQISRHSEINNVSPYIYGKQPEKYVEQLCLTLAPEGRRIDSKKFVQSFRKAVNLKDIVDVSDFVKYYVLEDQPLDIKRLDDSVTRYKEMAEAAEAVIKQLESMSGVNKSFKNWQNHKLDSLHYEWVEKEYHYILADSERAKLEDHIEKLEESISLAIKEQGKCTTALSTAGKLRDSLKQQLDSDSSESQSKTLKAEITMIQQRTKSIKKEMNAHLSILENISDLSRTKAPLKPVIELANLARNFLPEDSLSAATWPLDATAVDSGIPVIKEALESTISQVNEDLSRVNFECTTGAEKFTDDMLRLKQLELGGSNVNPSTLTLQKELLKHGIEAKPLSELAEITDVSWQKAIEAYLGGNVDALFVTPEETEEATRIFRKLNRRHRLYGASVINANKVQSWPTTVKKNTCATFIKSDNPIVKAFLIRILNRLVFTTTEKELLMENAAITMDGMLHKNGTIKSLRIRDELTLGKGAREQTIKNLKDKIATDGQTLAKLEAKLRIHNNTSSKLSITSDKVNQWSSVLELRNHLTKYDSDLELKTAQLDNVSLEHLDDIKASFEDALTKVKVLKEQDKNLTISISKNETLLSSSNEKLKSQIDLVDTCGQQRDAVEDDEHFDMEKAIRKSGKLNDEHSTDEAILEQAIILKTKHHKLIETHLYAAKQGLYKYGVEFKTEQPKDNATAEGLWKWVLSSIRQLEETELAKHEGAAKHALAEAETAFRHDIAFKLRENITNMELHIKELNKSLETRPFSGQEVYQFKYTANKEYEDILKFIEATSQEAQGNVGTLFDKDRKVADKIVDLIKSDEEKIADYRNYYSYDILINNKLHQTTSKLSKRIKTASGGENRTPYYVTIGASMASAYRISENYHGSGMGLVPLDEAFEKMDGNNFYQAAMYLKDIGLQMFLAAPDDSEMKLSTVVDTVIFLSRDGNSLSSTIKYLKDDASELLLSDNTILHPELLEETPE